MGGKRRSPALRCGAHRYCAWESASEPAMPMILPGRCIFLAAIVRLALANVFAFTPADAPVVVLSKPDDPYFALAVEIAEREHAHLSKTLDDAGETAKRGQRLKIQNSRSGYLRRPIGTPPAVVMPVSKREPSAPRCFGGAGFDTTRRLLSPRFPLVRVSWVTRTLDTATQIS